MTRATPHTLRPFIAFLLLLWAAAPAANAAPFHSADYGYSLSLPDDWSQISPQVLDQFAKSVTNPNGPKAVVYDAAFQPAAQPSPFTHPYMIVQVLPYANVGVNRQVREDEFPGIVKAITGVDIKKAADSQLSPQARALIGGAGFGKAQIDNARHRFIVPVNLTVNGVGKVNGQVTGYFGHDALVQVAVYTLKEDPASAPFQQIADSFHFDSASDFVPTPPNPLQRLLGGNDPARLVGIGVGLIVGVGLVLFLKARRNNAA